jgi:DNA-binding NarL/FixJ family response regulator
VSITEREAQIVRLIADGLEDKEIAPLVGLTWRSVKVMAFRIHHKLGYRNRTALAVAWVRGEIEVNNGRPCV